MEAEHSQVLKAAMLLSKKSTLSGPIVLKTYSHCFRMEPAGPQWLTPGLRKCKCHLLDIKL